MDFATEHCGHSFIHPAVSALVDPDQEGKVGMGDFMGGKKPGSGFFLFFIVNDHREFHPVIPVEDGHGGVGEGDAGISDSWVMTKRVIPPQDYSWPKGQVSALDEYFPGASSSSSMHPRDNDR